MNDYVPPHVQKQFYSMLTVIEIQDEACFMLQDTTNSSITFEQIHFCPRTKKATFIQVQSQ